MQCLDAGGRLIAVSDIHGHYMSLVSLLNKIQPVRGDKIVFLGDYINIGPDSRRVLDFLIQLKLDLPSTIFLKGNHEEMFLDYMRGDVKSFLLNGGYSTLRLYTGDDGKIIFPDAHIEFISGLLPFHVNDNFIFVHAGLQPGLEPQENSLRTILNIRREFIKSSYNWGKRVVFSHTPFSTPLVEDNKIGINCDVYNDGVIVGCDLIDEKFWFSSE